MFLVVYKPLIAVDIDDTIADSSEALRLEVNKTYRVSLSRDDYLIDSEVVGYYDKVWTAAGLQVSFDQLSTDLSIDQAHILPVEGVLEALKTLKENYRLVTVTSRDIEWKAATQVWVDAVFGDLFEGVYFTDDYIESGVAISKGELCARLGATLLIDDNPDFCDSAKECGIETILFGNYGWQKSRAGDFKLCRSWDELPDLID